MGRDKQGKPRRERPVRDTHEPDLPLADWPRSHVDSELTGPDDDECVLVTIHGIRHFLHATTASALHTSLGKTLDEYNGVCDTAGVPGV